LSRITFFCLLAAFVAWTIGFLGESTGLPMLAFALALVGFIALDVAIWFSSIKNNRVSFVLKAVFLSGTVGKIFPICVCVAILLNPDADFPWAFAILKQPFLSAFAYSIQGLCVFAILLFLRFFSVRTRYTAISDLVKLADPRLEWLLVIAGFFSVFYWLAITDFANPIFFLLRRISGALGFVPFFAGLAASRFRFAMIFWICILAFQLFVSFLTGTRGASFFPVCYFLMGYLVSLPTTEKRVRFTIWVIAPVLCSLVVLGVFIGVVRDIIGRTDLAGALQMGSLTERSKGIDVQYATKKKGGVLLSASSRLSSWPPLVVPLMTPNPIPYRGFDDLENELSSLKAFQLGSGGNTLNYYWPNYWLKPYGFAVHGRQDGVNKTSSVELSAFVDGFTRGGWTVGILYCLAAISVWVMVERLSYRFWASGNVSIYIIILATVANPTRFGVNGLFLEARLLILETILCSVVFFAASTILGSKDPKPKR
jgi:hypothetical protein